MWFDVNVGLDVDLCAEYESLSFDSIQTDLLFQYRMSEFVGFETFVPMIADLDQTLTHIALRGLVYLGPTTLPGPFIHDDQISRPMAHLLANYKDICLIPN